MEKQCSCGSGLIPEWLYDARGIECCKVCDECREERKQEYRLEIFADPRYWSCEDVDDD